jgi:hypothetical protein
VKNSSQIWRITQIFPRGFLVINSGKNATNAQVFLDFKIEKKCGNNGEFLFVKNGSQIWRIPRIFLV